MSRDAWSTNDQKRERSSQSTCSFSACNLVYVETYFQFNAHVTPSHFRLFSVITAKGKFLFQRDYNIDMYYFNTNLVALPLVLVSIIVFVI